MDQNWAPALLLVLIVHQGASVPLIEPMNGTLIKKKGDRISLRCTDLPGVRWITPSSAKKAIDQNRVNIKSADPKHTGRYICQNRISFENSSLYIFVEDSKNLFVTPSLRQMFISGTEGAEAVIPCRVTTPRIENLRLEKDKGTSMPKDLSYTADIYTGISITNLKRHFEGYYVCTAVRNGIVKKSVRFKLQIIPAEGYIKLLPPESSVLHVNIGENLVLNVEFDAYPAPDQQYWIHMNETLLNTSDHFIKSAKVGNRYISELHLVRVKGTEGGIYTFFASNSDSNSSVSFDVHINSSPEIITIEEPKPGNVRCVAIGFPKPKIKWLNCPGPQKRCSDTPMATAEELHWTNRIIRQPHFGRIEVESILNTKELNSNITVECLSSNSVGENRAIYQMKEGIPKTHHLFTPLLTLFAAAAGLLCVILVILFYKYQQKPRYQIQWKVVEGIHGNNYTYIDPTQLPYDDKWEFPRDKLRFGKTLGAGAFGKVVEASVYGMTKADSIMTVAVKMLKPSAHSTEKEALMSELKVLSHLGQHINIVNLLGACTIGGPVLVITEYCCFGDLLNFLRRKRDSFIWPENGEQNLEKTQYKNIPNLSNGSGSYMEMKPSSISSPQKNVDKRKPLRKESYSDKENNNEVTEEYNLALEIEDLLIFSYQVAKGMNFLSSKNCIHRDLAARNILLTNGQIAKICDFGLARDIRNDSNYVVKGNARLPVKWMAPESIFDCVYTFESDVWSYGILLWEIFSLGSSPYPGIPVDNKFYKMIKEGYRMLSPELASTELYEVMKACWDSDALRRPTFAQVVGMIEEQLSDTSKHKYSNLESNFTTRLKFSSHSSRLNSAGSSNASDQPLLMNDDVFFEDENKQM
ncbi:mast/stem cell growth factor receptor Kit-like isoform X2 [Cetorhinus maximus]